MSKPQEITEYMWTTWAQRNNLTNCQTVAMEGWDLRWEVERLQKIVAKQEAELTALRFDRAVLKAELNATRGKR